LAIAKARKYQFLEVFCEIIITSGIGIEREGRIFRGNFGMGKGYSSGFGAFVLLGFPSLPVFLLDLALAES